MGGRAASSDLRCGMASCKSERLGNVALPARGPWGPLGADGAGAARFLVGVGRAVLRFICSGSCSKRD